MFPAGIAAANLLGLSTQSASRGNCSDQCAQSSAQACWQRNVIIHTRRPESWGESLSDEDAALLDFLRRGGRTSELSPEGTVQRTLSLLSQSGRFERLLKVARSETPRVRAILGAIGEQLQEKKGPGTATRLVESVLAFRLRIAVGTGAC